MDSIEIDEQKSKFMKQVILDLVELTYKKLEEFKKITNDNSENMIYVFMNNVVQNYILNLILQTSTEIEEAKIKFYLFHQSINRFFDKCLPSLDEYFKKIQLETNKELH